MQVTTKELTVGLDDEVENANEKSLTE